MIHLRYDVTLKHDDYDQKPHMEDNEWARKYETEETQFNSVFSSHWQKEFINFIDIPSSIKHITGLNIMATLQRLSPIIESIIRDAL